MHTYLPHAVVALLCPFIVKREAVKLRLPIFPVFGLIRLVIKPNSTTDRLGITLPCLTFTVYTNFEVASLRSDW